jgi:dihydrofolate reductase
MRLTLHTFLTLDGVMQAPGGPDEDRDGGFAHGGWSFPYGDEDFGSAVTDWFGHASAFLLGRKTYEIFAGHWPRVTDPADPIAGKLNALPKYVASTTLASADWHNSSVLGGDVEHDLIDEYRLFWFPVHLGSGKKLFTDSARAAALRLVSTSATGAGVIISSYAPAGPPQHGSYELPSEP